MNRKSHCFVLLAVVSTLGLGLLHAQTVTAESSTESRLRDALRNTMLQLRDAQGQIETLQEAQTQSDKDKADLSAKVDALNAQIKSLMDQAVTDKATSDKALADLKESNTDLVTTMVNTLSTQINELDKQSPDDKQMLDKTTAGMKATNPDLAKQLDQYNADIQLWTMGYNQYVQYANKTEAARAQLAAQVIMLQRLVADRETKNLELYKTGSEILDRYQNYSLGDALAAKEPFIGITRAKLQELVQDYKDKLLAQKISIGQPPSPSVAVQEPGATNQNSMPPAKAVKQ